VWEGKFHVSPLSCEFRGRKDADRDLSHAQTIRLPYKEWAENHITRIKGVLDGARAEHTQSVKDRIDEVGQMKDVVDLTKGLFEISKVRTPPSLLMTHRSCIGAPPATGDCTARG
jgi:hypothetical protein